MIHFLKRPYVMAVISGTLLISFSIYVLLDAFVIPKSEKVVNNISIENTTAMNSEINIDEKDDTEIIESSKAQSVIDSNSYYDDNIQITIDTCREYDTTYYVADIVINDPSLLKTAFAKYTYGRNIKDTTSDMAEENNAILAINGDYYGFRNSGYVLRNGEVYRESISEDTEGEDLVIDNNGDFQIINESDVLMSQLEEQGVLQVFSFGPALVENGESVVSEDDEVGRAKASNPRTAIGQIDGLHYIIVVSDGRTDESEGLSLSELSDVLVKKGAITAYNLDGGGSSTLVFNGEVINNPTTNGKSINEREVSDIVYIGY